MLNHQLCHICLNENQSSFISLPCSCSACSDCLSQWITLNTLENQYTLESTFTCMTSDCQKDLSLKEIYHTMPKTHKEQIDEALLQVYLTNEQDIRKCPNPHCKYAGTIDPRSHCKENLQCEACGTTWRDKKQVTKREKVREWIKNGPKSQKNELFSWVWSKRKTKKCPSCRVKIEKNGGCNHMTCKKCCHEFCWICKQRHPNHNLVLHAIKKAVYPSIIITLALLILIPIFYYLYSIPAVKDMAGWTVVPAGNLMGKLAKWSFGKLFKFFIANALVFLAVFPLVRRKPITDGKMKPIGVMGVAIGLVYWFGMLSSVVKIIYLEVLFSFIGILVAGTVTGKIKWKRRQIF